MTNSILTWLMIGAAAGCAVENAEPTSETAQPIYGAEGDYEFAIDAPWRIEPTMPALDYGPIPITISIHDAHRSDDELIIYDSFTGGMSQVGLGSVKALTVTEAGVGTFTIPLDSFHEIERTVGAWPLSGSAPSHLLCRRWAGDTCAGMSIMKLSDASEWHATVLYTPRGARTPGRDVRLDFALTVSRINRKASASPLPVSYDDVVFKNQVSVHLGEAPLPRFDDTTWAYGDLHYHSQGTDNEGESAYAYRSVVHAMSAVGLDFVLASEHASDSEQMVDLDLPPQAIYDPTFSGLRDMNATRYSHLWSWLHDADGANREAVRSAPRLISPLRQRTPQIFLGGEVDVMPETVAGSYVIDYGNGLHYDIMSACARRPGYIPIAMDSCDTGSIKSVTADGRWIVRDPQGGGLAPARQHLLYLPNFATTTGGFISSQTTKWGGARFRLKDLVHSNFELNNQGDFFLAHPNDAANESGFDSLGPDIVPYSEAQYRDLFGVQHFLGLQFWNSDTRRTINASFGINRLELWGGATSTWQTAPEEPSIYGELHHGAATWDRLLLAGMDGGRTAEVPWLGRGEPRKFFMAGGSDAHGDLNFRRKGYMTLLGSWVEDISDVTDTAIGTPRNLVHAGTPAGNPITPGLDSTPFTQDQVFAAMARGEFAVTDGPALRLVWDVNENGAIDSADVPMGGAIKYDPQVGPPTLLVQWKSTPEFGVVEELQLYVGAAAGSRGVTYARAGHGPREAGTTTAGLPLPGGFLDEGTGRTMVVLDDGYWQNDTLAINPAAWPNGIAKLKLRPSDFRVGTKGPRVCRTLQPGGPSNCFHRFDNPVDPEQLYVRAFARTGGRRHPTQGCANVPIHDAGRRLDGFCIPRLAFTNPVWARPAHPMRASTIVDANGRCLDVLGAVAQNGAPIGVWSCNGLDNQRWVYDTTGKTLVGFAGKLLDALGWQSWEGAAVGLWDRDGASNQQWTLRGVEVRGLEGKLLDVAGSWEGAAAVITRGTGSATQRWTLTPAGELRSSDNRCLDVYGHWTHDGAPVLVYNCYGTANQKWRVMVGGMLQGTESGKCLAAAGDSANDGTGLVLAPCNAGVGQRWSLRGEIRAWNDKCLDVYGSYDADGTAVQLYTCHGGANQRFTVFP